MEGFPPEYQQEVQDALASVLNADLILSISGAGTTKYPLLAVLEILLSRIAMASGHSREVAVHSFRDMLAKIDVEDVTLIILPSFARLASNRDSTKSRQSASELLPDIYFAVGDSNVSAKISIQSIAATLSKDCMNTIVQSVSQSLSVCIERGMCTEDVASFVLPLYNDLAKDEHPHVRAGACDILISMAVRDGEFHGEALSGLNNCMQDSHWAIRLKLAAHFAKLYKALGLDTATQKDLARFCSRLLEDNMFVVRRKTLEILQEIMLLMKRDTFSEFIMPKLTNLASDIFSQVRLALAQNIKEVWAYMNDNRLNEDANTVLAGVISALLQDNESSEVLVCTLDHLSSNIIANSMPLNSSGRNKLETDITEAMKKIFDLKNRQWRHRQYLLDMIPDLVSRNYTLDEDRSLCDVVLLMKSALCDSVWSVRMSAVDNIPRFMSVVSEKKNETCRSAVRNTAMVSIVSTIRDAPHAGRIAALKVLNSLIPNYLETLVDGVLIPSIISSAVSDPVSTVRLYATQVLLSVKYQLSSTIGARRYDDELRIVCATIDTLKLDEDERIRSVIGTTVMTL